MGLPDGEYSPQIPHTSRILPARRDAAVSCHVESPLDDAVWAAFERFQRSRPGGFRIAALLRAPHAGEDEERWLERARVAAAHGPLGHHTHYARPDHARPLSVDDVRRVRSEAVWIRAHDLAPTLFCGGGWYVDEQVAEVAVEFGYVDCTGVAFRHPYFAATEREMLEVPEPSWLELPTGHRLLELPSTHSVGMLARSLAKRLAPPFVHLYFHDTDLLLPRRRLAIEVVVRLLALRCRATDLDHAARAYAETAPSRPFQRSGSSRAA